MLSKMGIEQFISNNEDKEICIFDELAADQDHHFRKYFYEVILADLKKAGKTVIAVTHDDSYWGVADRVIKFDYGQLAAPGSQSI